MTGPEGTPSQPWQPKTPEEVKKEFAAKKALNNPGSEKGEKPEKRAGEGKREQGVDSMPWTAAIEMPALEQPSKETAAKLQARAKAIEVLLAGSAKGKIAAQYEEVRGQGMDRYLEESGKQQERKSLMEFFTNSTNARLYDDAVSILGVVPDKKSWFSVLQEQASEKPEGGPDRGSWLRAIEMASKVFNEAVRREHALGARGGKPAEWTDLTEEGRLLLRLSEIVHVTAHQIRMEKGWLSDEEKQQTGLYMRMRRQLINSKDVPESWKKILNESEKFPEVAPVPSKKSRAVAAKAKKTESTQELSGAKVAQVVEPKQSEAGAVAAAEFLDPGDTERIQPMSEETKAGLKDVWKAESWAKKPERVVEPWKLKIFDQEVEVPSAEHRKLSRELKGLMTESEKDPQKMLQARFRAARMLAHLRRAGVRLENPKGKERVDAELNARRGEMSALGGEHLSHYLMFLKYTGALKGSLHESEAVLIREDITRRADLVNPGNLLQMCSNAKYLGMQPDARLIPAFERELKLVVDSGDARRMTYALGRLNYLKVTSPGLEKLRNAAMPQVQEYLAKTPGEGAEREQFVNTYLVATSVVRVPELPPALRGGLVEQAMAARKEAEAAGKPAVWQRLAVYLGSLVSLTQRIEKGIPEPGQPVEPTELAEEPGWLERLWVKIFGSEKKPETRKPPVRVQLPGEPQPVQGPPGQVQEFMQDLAKPAPSGEVSVPEAAEQPKAESLIKESEKGSAQLPPATGEKQKISIEKLAEELGIRPTYLEAMKENIKYAIKHRRLSMPAGFEKTPEGKIVPDKETQKKLEDYEKIAEAMGYDLDLSELEIDMTIPNVTVPIYPLRLFNP